MKEIDFIPEWYKADRKRKRRCVRQSTLIAVVFVIMMVWGVIIDRYVASVRADVQEIQNAFLKAQEKVGQTLELQSEINQMKYNVSLLDKLQPRTDMTSIIAEVSYLMRDNVVLSQMTLKNEPIGEFKRDQQIVSNAVVQIGAPKEKEGDIVEPQVPSRVEMTLTGVATKPADAAELISRLENSQYFNSVTLVFSRPKEFKDADVTEFKIRCYVADYQIKE